MSTTSYRARTAVEILREWAQEESTLDPQITVVDLLDRARYVFQDDEEFLDAILMYGLRSLLPGIVRSVWADHRKSAQRLILNPDADAQYILERLNRWFEVTDSNVHKRLIDMNRHDLLFSAEEREKRATGELRVARFERDLASRLNSDRETVGERYNPHAILSLWEKHSATGLDG